MPPVWNSTFFPAPTNISTNHYYYYSRQTTAQPPTTTIKMYATEIEVPDRNQGSGAACIVM
ncbi:hypothetical protein BDY21DRAFT_368203 [Lineolata rhizophorae]|uniref:Uncharacterized protein n=1 Tax=Lineolata rhizophorae TaxID=578093 RepID=A0A6A6PDL5_9PEZI|nr:hypothetical protein BDY21DRAFT_368203 [Lineolata rhizophorae]